MPKRRVSNITINTGVYWGMICLIPFGWVFFMLSIIRRKNDVIKYEILDARLALRVLRNYIISFIIMNVIGLIACKIPNPIAIIAIIIAYNIAVDKVLDFMEEKYPDEIKTDTETGCDTSLKKPDNKAGTINFY